MSPTGLGAGGKREAQPHSLTNYVDQLLGSHEVAEARKVQLRKMRERNAFFYVRNSGPDPERVSSVPPQMGGQVQQRHVQVTFHMR